MDQRTIVGIDLGTTFSSIGYVNQHGRPEIIPNREGERIMPSVVLFDGETPIVGTIAKRSAGASPRNICEFVKRKMGEKDWRFPAENDKEYTAEEVSALILKRLKEDASTSLGFEIRDAVITVPAYFNDAQRKATQDAGRIAGLNVVRIINEPTAAALAYGLDKIAEPHTIMVYDLGGGTFDVTIMRISRDEIEIIATGGDKNLGGFDWDNKVMDLLNDEFKASGGQELLEDLALTHDLRDRAEIAKKTLSSRDNTKVFLSAGGKNVTLELSLKMFDQITSDLVNRTETLMEMTLEDAGLGWNDIDKILLVGGSTRMKAVPQLIERVTGKKPSCELHPDEVVTIGAALMGAILQKETGEPGMPHLDNLPCVRISDVNSHSLGVIALDIQTGKEFNSIILPKDTKTLTKVSETYGTVVDNQTEILVQITEGEEEDPNYVEIVGTLPASIPRYPKGAPVEIFFQYDNNGIIQVMVLDLTSNKMIAGAAIVRRSNRSETEIQQMSRQMDKTEVG